MEDSLPPRKKTLQSQRSVYYIRESVGGKEELKRCAGIWVGPHRILIEDHSRGEDLKALLGRNSICEYMQ